MAKAKAPKRRPSVTAQDFIDVYIPAATSGKSALEIAKELKLKGTDEKITQYVTVKASQLRDRLRKAAAATADKKGLKGKEKDALVAAAGGKGPKLKSQGRASEVAELSTYIDSLLAKLDPPAEDEAETPEKTE